MQISESIQNINKKVVAIVSALLVSMIMIGTAGTVGATGNSNGDQQNNNGHCTWRYSEYHGSTMHMRWNDQNNMWEECHDNDNHSHSHKNRHWNNGNHYGWRNNHQNWLHKLNNSNHKNHNHSHQHQQ